MVPFDAGRYAEMTRLPKATVDYYRECTATGRAPLLFVGVPHILVEGAIRVDDLETVGWADGARLSLEGVARRVARLIKGAHERGSLDRGSDARRKLLEQIDGLIDELRREE